MTSGAFDVAPARRIAEAHMTQGCELSRPVRRRDASGYLVEEGHQPYLSAPCRLRQASSREEVVAGQLAERVEAVVCLPVGTPVENDDRILVDGEEYEVSGIIATAPDYKAQEKALVRRR